MKKCSRCGEEKPDTEEFFRHKYRVKLSGVCKECDKIYAREQYHKHKHLKSDVYVPDDEPEVKHKAQKEAVKRTPTERGTYIVTFGDDLKTPRREIKSAGFIGYTSSLARIF